MKHLLAVAAGLATCGAAQAQEISFKPIADARLRYELVDQDGLSRNAGAVTLRLRPGVIASAGEWSALVEGETNIVLVDQYNDGLNGRVGYPLVADPANAEINRAQIRYAGRNGLGLTAGRQRIELADQRFVGPAPWRQNEQTFDAVRLQWGKPRGLRPGRCATWGNGVHGSFGAFRPP